MSGFDETDLANTYGAKSFGGRKGERETYGDTYRGRGLNMAATLREYGNKS